MRHFTTHLGLQVILWLVLSQYVTSDCLLPELDFPDGTYNLPESYIDDENRTVVEEMSLLLFTCSPGYALIGPEFLQCDNEKWSSEVPFCVDMKCPRPPSVENATYEVQSGLNNDTVVGSSAVYTCKDGHMLEKADASTLRCNLDRKSKTTSWIGENPVCIEKNTCPDPGVSVNGRRSGDCHKDSDTKCEESRDLCKAGDKLNYTCNDGYELVGNWKLSCLRTGIWSSGRPMCRPLEDYCEFPPPVPLGVLTGHKQGDYFLAGDEARLLCKPGYKCEGEEFVVCGRGGEWEREFGVCKEIFCDLPPPIAQGTIPELQTSNLTIFPYDFDIHYVCDEGYRIFGGDSWRSCGKRGWSGRTPRCEVIQCPDPGIPENGLKMGSNYSVGSTVRFMCFSGYQLLGSFEMHCKPNGQWTGEVARCNTPNNYCPDPGTPISGSKNTTEYKMGDRVRFHCQPKYILLGSEVRQCLPDTTWSGTETRCVGRYDFDSRVQVRDILRAKLIEEREQNEKVQRFLEYMHCCVKRGMFMHAEFPRRTILYFAFHVPSSVTQTYFSNCIALAKAIVREVGISPNGARAGALTFSSRAQEMFLPFNYNSTQDVLDALDKINYTGGGSAASSSLTLIRTEYIPLVKQRLGDEEMKSVIFILTDGKANMGGNPKEEAEILKAEGVEIYYIGITGDYRKNSLYVRASTSRYGEEMRPNAFILQDYGTLAWLAQEITNSTADYSECGLTLETGGINNGKIVGGNRSSDPWPWMAALYVTEENDGPERRKLKCGGSIIDRRFILTAAHCLFDKEGRLQNSENISVVLGLTVNEAVFEGIFFLKEKKYLQEIEVREIHVHPRYQAMSVFDCDVALLELDRPIEYNAYVRPICLPPKELPEDSHFYKPQTVAWAIGWSHESFMSKLIPSGNKVMSWVLKEVALPIQPRETCKESLRDHRFGSVITDTTFCAGEGEGNQDTCGGRSGGPVMQSQWNKDGYFTWVQVGIVSCGLERYDFEYYTHLQKLIPWVDNITVPYFGLMNVR